MLITLVITANLQIILSNQVCSQHHDCIHSCKLNVRGAFPWLWGVWGCVAAHSHPTTPLASTMRWSQTSSLLEIIPSPH